MARIQPRPDSEEVVEEMVEDSEESTEEDAAPKNQVEYEMDIESALQDALGQAKDDQDDPASDGVFNRNLRRPSQDDGPPAADPDARVIVRNSAASNLSKDEIKQRNRKEYFELRTAISENRRMEESDNYVVVCSDNCPSSITPSIIEVPHKKVFVTSASYNGNLGGVSGANEKCQLLATEVGLEGNFEAWVLNPSSNFDRSFDNIPYYLIDGTLVADNWIDLTDGGIQNPINMDENGDIVPSGTRAWTATNSGGNAQGNDCNDWTKGSVSDSFFALQIIPCVFTN